jgi:DNA mismatch endonuclease Vsr
MMRPQASDAATFARMKSVRRSGTRIETVVANALRAAGHRYRRNVRSLPGSPDFANQRRRWAVFVNGCYWHHHKGCSKATVPKRNTAFWTAKFRDNRARDARAVRALRSLGYRVVIVWECSSNNVGKRLAQIPKTRRIDRR